MTRGKNETNHLSEELSSEELNTELYSIIAKYKGHNDQDRRQAISSIERCFRHANFSTNFFHTRIPHLNRYPLEWAVRNGFSEIVKLVFDFYHGIDICDEDTWFKPSYIYFPEVMQAIDRMNLLYEIIKMAHLYPSTYFSSHKVNMFLETLKHPDLRPPLHRPSDGPNREAYKMIFGILFQFRLNCLIDIAYT